MSGRACLAQARYSRRRSVSMAALSAGSVPLSPSLKRLSPTPIPVSDNPSLAKGSKYLGKTVGGRRVGPIMGSYVNCTRAEPKAGRKPFHLRASARVGRPRRRAAAMGVSENDSGGTATRRHPGRAVQARPGRAAPRGVPRNQTRRSPHTDRAQPPGTPLSAPSIPGCDRWPRRSSQPP